MPLSLLFDWYQTKCHSSLHCVLYLMTVISKMITFRKLHICNSVLCMHSPFLWCCHTFYAVIAWLHLNPARYTSSKTLLFQIVLAAEKVALIYQTSCGNFISTIWAAFILDVYYCCFFILFYCYWTLLLQFCPASFSWIILIRFHPSWVHSSFIPRPTYENCWYT